MYRCFIHNGAPTTQRHVYIRNLSNLITYRFGTPLHIMQPYVQAKALVEPNILVHICYYSLACVPGGKAHQWRGRPVVNLPKDTLLPCGPQAACPQLAPKELKMSS